MGLGLTLKRSLGWILGSYTPTKSFDPVTSTYEEFRQSYATLLAELNRSNLLSVTIDSGSTTYTFSRPDGTSVYKRPGGTDNYLRA